MWSATRSKTPAGADAAGVYRHRIRGSAWVNPLFVPGFPVALKLGLAGGPLIMALILGRIGSIGKLYWFMPPSANLALRELGIVLFLAVVGLKSGGDFVDTLTQGEGLSWIGYGIFITAIPLITVGLLARILPK